MRRQTPPPPHPLTRQGQPRVVRTEMGELCRGRGGPQRGTCPSLRQEVGDWSGKTYWRRKIADLSSLLLLLLSCFSHVRLCVTPWTAAHQAPPSMEFSRQEYWSQVPLPSPLRSQVGKKRKRSQVGKECSSQKKSKAWR